MSHVDYTLFKTINGWSGSSFADRVLTALAKDHPAVMVVLVALVFLVRWPERRQERRAGAVLATAAAGLAGLSGRPTSERIRPVTLRGSCQFMTQRANRMQYQPRSPRQP